MTTPIAECCEPLLHPCATYTGSFLCTLDDDHTGNHEARSVSGLLARWTVVDRRVIVSFDVFGVRAPSLVTATEAARFLSALEVSRGGLDPDTVGLPQYDYLVVGALFAADPEQVAAMELAAPGYVQAFRWVTTDRGTGMQILGAIAKGPF